MGRVNVDVIESGNVEALPVPKWKPLVFRKPYLMFLMLCSVAVIAGTEILVRLSLRTDSIFSFDLQQSSTCVDQGRDCSYAKSSISVGFYFCYKYLPILLAVILAAMWEAFDSEVRRLESYYQLAGPNGALAADSLLANWNTMSMPKIPFQAWKKKCYFLLLSFFTFLLAGIAAPVLQAALLIVDISATNEAPLWAVKVHVDIKFARALQIVHGFVAALSLGLAFMLHRRHITGLFASPGSIASLAATVGPTLAQDLHHLDLANDKALVETISKRRYVLQVTSDASGRAVQQIDRALDDAPTCTAVEFNVPEPPMTKYGTIAWSGFLMIIIATFFGLEAFSGKTHIKFIFSHRSIPVLLGIILKAFWKTMDRDLSILEPFNYLAMHPLAHRENFSDLRSLVRSPFSISNRFRIFPNPAWKTILLDYNSANFFFKPFHAAGNKHVTMCVVALMSWLIEVFTVCMGSLGTLPCYKHRACPAGKPIDTSMVAINALVGLSFGILLLMTFVELFMIMPRAASGNILNRRVDNMASVLCWLHSSRMVEGLRPMSTMDPSQRADFIRSLQGKLYGLGFINSDGQLDRFGIDQEPVEAFVNKIKALPLIEADGKRTTVRYRPDEHKLGFHKDKEGHQYT